MTGRGPDVVSFSCPRCPERDFDDVDELADHECGDGDGEDRVLIPDGGRDGSDRSGVEPVEEAKESLKSAERDWDYLSGEERHGTIVQALEALERATDPSVCDSCGREVTLMGGGLCGHCQSNDRDVSADAERGED